MFSEHIHDIKVYKVIEKYDIQTVTTSGHSEYDLNSTQSNSS